MTSSPPRRRWIRWALLALAILLLLPLGALAVFALTFDANAWKPRIEAAVEAATGRGFSIAGPIGTKLSLRPTVTLAEASLANPPGFSRPAFATLRRAELQVALLPLLARRVEVARLVLDGADVLLERNAQGEPNWVLGRPAQPGPAAPGPAAGPARPLGLEIGTLLLTDSRLALQAAPDAPPRVLAVRRLALEAAGADRRLALSGAAAWQDRALSLSGEAAPLAGLLSGAATPWPLRLDIGAEGGLALRLEGVLTPPAGYRLAVTAKAEDLTALAPLLPDQPIPPLRAVEASATLLGAGGPPAVSELRLAVGPSDLGVLRPGLVLERAVATVPALDHPVALEAAARLAGVPLTLSGRVGAPARLLATGGAPWPVELAATAGDAKATVAGSIADPWRVRGIDVALTAELPELGALAPLVPKLVLPALRQVAAQGRLASAGPGLDTGATLRDLRVTASAGDLEGELAWTPRPRQALTGVLRSARLDLDAAWPAPRPAPPAAAPGPAEARPPAQAEGQNGDRPSDERQAGERAAGERRVIPDIALPLDLLRLVDGDIRLSVQALRAGGADWQAVEARAVMQGGRGRLDPAVASLAGAGRVTLRAAADIATEPPTVQVALRTEGLELAALPVAAGTSGRLGLDADLRGSGRALRAVAGSAHGRLGLTLEGGQVPPALLGELLAGLRQRVPGVEEIARRPLALGCVAARLELADGLAAGRVALVESGLGRIGAEDGFGAVNLRDETLALRLNADLRLPVPGLPNGLRLRAPLPVTGTLARPRPEWNAAAGAALQGELADRAGGQAGQLLGALGGILAGRGDAGPGPIPSCAEALALARGQAVPAPAPAAAPAEPPRRDPAQELLRRLPLDRLPLDRLLGR